jgi:methylase of polypeptide subunit release factors
VGTGTGVLAALLVKQGVKHVVGTDTSARALLCAQDNINRLNMGKHITLQQGDLFPEGQADLIVCNPPWLPGRPASTLEQAVYDQDQHMLLGFLSGLSKHLAPKGQGWLILSDLAEHLGLRSRAALLAAIERADLVVLERLDTRPIHPKAKEEADPLADARRAEVTSLWRLAAG